MAKVIGQDTSVAKRVSCKGCGTRIEYYENDVKSFVHHDYGGGSDTYRYINCPGCDNKVYVK